MSEPIYYVTLNTHFVRVSVPHARAHIFIQSCLAQLSAFIVKLCEDEWWAQCLPATLRTFARKSSIIENLIKLLLLIANELLLSEMQKLIGVTDFVLKIWYLKVHAYFEKSVLVIRYDLRGCWCKNIMNESFEQVCIADVYLGRSIKRIYSTVEVSWGKTNLK